MFWFRIDNRLIHGQVIEGWLPYLDANELVVVNDDLADNDMQQQILMLAVPGRVNVRFETIESAKRLYDTMRSSDRRALYLLATCADAAKLAESGVPVPVLNIGNMHYAQGKKQLCAHVAASDADVQCLRHFVDSGTQLDFRCVPTDVPQISEGWESKW